MNDNAMTCVNHSQTRTGLRCKDCDQPVCAKCVVLTPVGYRCKACEKKKVKVFETARLSDYILVPVVVMTLAGVGSLFSMISLWLTVIATPVAVGLIVEAAQRVVGRRWSRHLRRVVSIAYVVGCLPMACFLLTPPTDLWSVAGLLLYIGIGVYTLRAR
jgi:hypothetical protein